MFKYCFLLLVLSGQTCFGKLPSTITPCRRNDPQLEKCIIDAVYKLKPKLATGDLGEGYQTPALEPLYLDNIEIGNSRQFQAVFSEIMAYGGSNFRIDKLSANASDISYDVSLTLPKIEFTGKYMMRLNILLLDIQGKGTMEGNFENAKANVKMRGTRYLRDGVEYVKFTKMPIRINARQFKLRLNNLFNGDKVLGEVGNRIINENQELYLKEIIPGLERELSQKFLMIANEILETTTFDEMFPTD
ncbi:protein takeout [Eurosta solidaginis]|uniref:protein takeout n=1 Tax=Eurosta solidaginis TaxID=178769 RepID=UPI0035311DFB